MDRGISSAGGYFEVDFPAVSSWKARLVANTPTLSALANGEHVPSAGFCPDFVFEVLVIFATYPYLGDRRGPAGCLFSRFSRLLPLVLFRRWIVSLLPVLTATPTFVLWIVFGCSVRLPAFSFRKCLEGATHAGLSRCTPGSMVNLSPLSPLFSVPASVGRRFESEEPFCDMSLTCRVTMLSPVHLVTFANGR